MKLIKISRDRLQRSLSHGYFKKISNSSNSSLTQSDYKSIIDKLDIANQEHAGSVDAIFSLLIKKNPDIENNAEFRNIRNGINAEIFQMGSKYDQALRESLKSTPENVKDNTAEIKNFEHIKNEMFELVKKFYKSGYKIIAYDIMRQLSILSEWMDDAINDKNADKNKHKIKEIFSPDSDFHKSFLYLNKIKSLLQKPSLKDELAKFSTEIHTNEKEKVVDIGECIKATNASSAVGSFFGLLADKDDSKIINNYVRNTIIGMSFGRSYDELKLEKPLSAISTIKDSFIKVDEKCNIIREANGKVGIFDINNKNSTQTYEKDRKKRFNDFKTMVLNIFENEQKYSGKLKNKSTDFFLGKDPPEGAKELKSSEEGKKFSNIIKLFEAVVTEGGMKDLDYRKCENIANKIGLNDLINNLIYNFNQIDPKYEPAKIKDCLDVFITKFNDRINGNGNEEYFKKDGGRFFLKKHKGFNALSEGIRKITGEMSSGFDFIAKSSESQDKVIKISNSFNKWHDKQVEDLEKGKNFLKQIASPKDDTNIDSSELIKNLSPKDIENMKKYASRMLERNIKENQLIRQANLDAKRQAVLRPFRLANDNQGNVYYPPEGKDYPNFYQSPYPLGIYPEERMLFYQNQHLRSGRHGVFRGERMITVSVDELDRMIEKKIKDKRLKRSKSVCL